MDESTREDYYLLHRLIGQHTCGLGALLRDSGGVEAALSANSTRLAELPAATQRMLKRAQRRWFSEKLRRQRAPASAEASPATSLAEESQFIPIGDPAFPPLLREIPDPPPWLICRGNPRWLRRPAVAIVGSRRASHAGLSAAHRIGKALACAGYTVCSGMALGIDAAAHRGALEGGATAAILASGLDKASPHRHRALADKIALQGCVATELPTGTPPEKHQFPRRNRIISGLAQATIIVEAALPSGSLHTAAAALEQGRDVYTLPWSIFHEQGAGCLRLLRDGATPITALDELAQLFPGVAMDPVPACNDTTTALPADNTARALLSQLGDSTLSLSTLQRDCGLAASELLALLAELELQGWVRRVDSGYQRVSRT